MKVLLYGKDAELLRTQVEEAGLSIVKHDPEVVLSYGGDGTLLRAERAYPGLPKLPVRNSKICKLCPNMPNDSIFDRVKQGKYKMSRVLKLSVKFKGHTYWALNDSLMTHAVATHAIRFTIAINDKPYAQGREIIGDGIIVATPFGSGAYYRSITDGTFSTGIGLAFNNTTEQVDHIVLRDTDVIRFNLTRGKAQFAVDIEPLLPLAEGDTVEITGAQNDCAQIISFGEEFTYWSSS